jgi:hypothetical protein
MQYAIMLHGGYKVVFKGCAQWHECIMTLSVFVCNPTHLQTWVHRVLHTSIIRTLTVIPVAQL